jgi:HEAT repeat protein
MQAPDEADVAPHAASPDRFAPTPDPYDEEEALAEALRDLKSSDPEVRADALLEIEPEGAGISHLTDALRDPDPEVRMAAIGQLEDGESRESIEALELALDDRDPEVVIEAIDALEYVGDSSAISSLERLLNHPNEEVREAALDAIDYLEE